MSFQKTTIGPCKLINGDCLEVLKELKSESVHCVVTSPPYFGLRDYGTAKWEGGDEECDHEDAKIKGRADYGFRESSKVQRSNIAGGFSDYKRSCPECGAKRIDQQIGSEQTPDEFVSKMVEVFGVFGEIWRVLRDDGTFWLNLGDSFSGGSSSKQRTNIGSMIAPLPAKPLPSGNLIGIPWLVALALQADGWILRSDIIWYKPNPMPESVKNRCTKSHEYIFMLVKKMGYYYNQEAIKEKAISTYRSSDFIPNSDKDKLATSATSASSKNRSNDIIINARNKRSVWTIPTQSSKENHFATYPIRLIDPCVKAGCPKNGIVLDPFSGLATTGIVAIRNNCKYIGIELSEKYHNISCKRIKKEWKEHTSGFFHKQYTQRPETNTIKKKGFF